ncbi:YnfU family zinc-binding protein [Biostraticola tofi]|uniref:YnfU family zinc-binding protein n=1 Tax=Biostraticola tofi TaxID=466109 RepID=UPI001E2ADF8D|nr:YnfU family zinc-binding protein [Biostraticola tofi]
MSYFSDILSKVTSNQKNTQCPICHKFARQDAHKVAKGLAMLCPHCHALFVKP